MVRGILIQQEKSTERSANKKTLYFRIKVDGKNIVSQFTSDPKKWQIGGGLFECSYRSENRSDDGRHGSLLWEFDEQSRNKIRWRIRELKLLRCQT